MNILCVSDTPQADGLKELINLITRLEKKVEDLHVKITSKQDEFTSKSIDYAAQYKLLSSNFCEDNYMDDSYDYNESKFNDECPSVALQKSDPESVSPSTKSSELTDSETKIISDDGSECSKSAKISRGIKKAMEEYHRNNSKPKINGVPVDSIEALEPTEVDMLKTCLGIDISFEESLFNLKSSFAAKKKYLASLISKS